MPGRALAWMLGTVCQTRGWAGWGATGPHTSMETFTHAGRKIHPHSYHLFYPLGVQGSKAGNTHPVLEAAFFTDTPLAWLLGLAGVGHR